MLTTIIWFLLLACWGFRRYFREQLARPQVKARVDELLDWHQALPQVRDHEKVHTGGRHRAVA